jgi:alpha-mannosidase
MNAYQWADKIDFSKAHVFSWVMNNYWVCNFKNGQSGRTTLRYRLTSYAGEQDPARATRFAWQPFQPILPIWLDGKPAENERPFASVDGESVLLGCLKTAETKDCLIVRLLEMRGEPAEAILRLNPPRGRSIARAFRANCLEVEQQPLTVTDGSIRLKLKPHEIATVGVEVK